MNVALFIDSYLPTKSGIVTVIIQLRKILEEFGHHVVIVTVDNGHHIPELDADKNLYRMKAIPVKLVGNDQFFGFPNMKDIVNFLTENKIEIIHYHSEFSCGQAAVKAGKIMNIPVIATTHTMWEDYYRHYLKIGYIIPKAFIRKLARHFFKKVYALINVSQKAHDYYNRPYMLPHIPSTVVPNAIDSKKFIAKEYSEEEKAELRNKYGLSKEDKLVIYVGRVVEEKRVLELLTISKRLVTQKDHLKMMFVGAGAPLSKMQKIVKDAGLSDKIIFTGFVDWFEVSKLYSIGDVFVTVSLSEMHSMTILEALSLGLPVVCRRDTSFSDTVFQGENGFMCDSDEELDEYIFRICDDDNLHAQMSQKALEISKRFTLQIHGLRTIAFYQKVLENYPNKLTSEELKKAVENCTQQ